MSDGTFPLLGSMLARNESARPGSLCNLDVALRIASLPSRGTKVQWSATMCFTMPHS